MASLRIANDIRRTRARWKDAQRDLRRADGAQRAADMMTAMPDWAMTMPVRDIIGSVSFVGREKTRRMMVAARIGSSRSTLGSIGQDRRQLLIQALCALSAEAAKRDRCATGQRRQVIG